MRSSSRGGPCSCAWTGTPWLVDWCGGPLEWPTEQTAGRLLDQLRGKLVSEAKAQRLFR